MSADAILLLTIATITLSSFVQSVTGFGFGLVAMSLLPLFLSFNSAYFVLMIPNLAVCTMNFVVNCRHFRWRQGLGLIIGSCLAVPLGFYFMIHMKSEWLMRGLGLLICVFSTSELLMAKRRPLRLAENLGVPMGLFSGSLSGAFNMGGPPAIAYVYSQSWTKEHTVALLQVVFGLSSVIRLFLMQGAGMITADLLRVSLFAIVPLLLAILAGNRLLRKMQHQHLRLVVFLFLLVIGVKYLFKL
jgi:uncharacterized protein